MTRTGSRAIGALFAATLFSLPAVASAEESLFVRGDVNQDGRVDVSDAVSVLFYLFLAGHAVDCEKSADLDDTGAVGLTDAIYVLRFLFQGGPAPKAPFDRCGPDPTPDGLDCARSACGAPLPAIEIEARCPADPATQLAWRLRNSGTAAATVSWQVAGSAQGGDLVLPASGSADLTTEKLPGANELVVLHAGREVARLAQAGLALSEILASSATGISDEDGDTSDWIEIRFDSPCASSLDLEGWYLTDDPLDLAKWRFPRVALAPGGYLVVFASGKDRAVAGSELHTNFKLDAAGEYLALVAPDGATIADEFRPFYPEQRSDVSYGLVRASTALVEPGAQAAYRVPAASDAGLGSAWADPAYVPSGWRSGRVGLGFTGIAGEGFAVTCIRSRVQVSSLSVAQSVLSTPSQQLAVYRETAPYIDYFNSGESGNFRNDRPFPGLGTTDYDDFVVSATATIFIPEAGAWTFGVNSDDGFSLELKIGARTYRTEYPSPRGPADTIQVFNLAQAGPCEVSLLFYERGGGSEVELFAARGSYTTFNSGVFRLVGDTAHGGLGFAGFAREIATDVGTEMRGVNASLWLRVPFQLEDPGAFAGLVLRAKYEDGFVAYLNGREVARRNASAALSWNSAASSNRPIEGVPVAEEIDLAADLDLLRPGANLLAIHALNDSAADADFLVAPELVAYGRGLALQYMATPTPGKANVPGAANFVRSVEFSRDHGFFDAPFSLTLATLTPGAEIRYTLDGSTPAAAAGYVYTAPLTISRTTTIRAAAFKPGHLDSLTRTKTYLFVNDVIRQSPNGAAPGPGWPTGTVNDQVIDYGMDPDIVNNARWSGQVRDALLAIPTISLVTDLENLFDPSSGIYVNAWRDGRAWERRTSVELIHPDGREGFALDAGLRIRGAFSRSGQNPKHAFRLFFRNEYGAGKLEYPLFGGEGAERYDKVDLRTSQNYSWAYEGSAQNTFLRDVFSRDAQRDMHQPYTRSRYYHLYLNGQYWGLYQTEERADADYAETYLGGKAADYDAIKNDSSGSRALHATDGTMDAYRRLYDAAVAGFATDAAYYRVQGLRSDGTPDPAGEKLLDPENLMDYMACTYYTGDPDSPVSCWAHFSNNVFAVYDRVKPDGFKWFRHDAEHSLGANGGLYEARILTDPTDRTIGQYWEHFNPAWLHLRLTAHREYALAFADRVNRRFSPGGVHSPAANIERWLARAGEIELAIVAESARWGDAKTHPPRTKDDWQAQVDYMVATYFPQRTQIVIDQMRSVAMFPAAAIVSFHPPGGEMAPGASLLMSQGNGTAGTIYYTLDGSDPRLRGGAVNPAALVYEDSSSGETLVARGSLWRYLDDGSDQGTAWRDPSFDDSVWNEGPAELGYGDGDEATVVSYGPDSSNKYTTTYFRRAFTAADASRFVGLRLGLLRDDGAVVYLNGVEVARSNMPGGAVDYLTLASGAVGGTDESTFYTYDLDPSRLREGRNVLAVEVHQSGPASSDLSFDLELSGTSAGGAIPILRTATVKARVRAGTEWGALTSARFTVGLRGLVLNELMAANRRTLEDPDEPGEFPDWIEIHNGTPAAIDLSGMYLTDNLQDLTKWRIPDGTGLAAGGHIIFYADDDGTQGPRHTNFHLSQISDAIALVDADGETVLDSVLFELQSPDVSYGRYPDGSGAWGFHETPTPGSANAPHRR
mgnify:CR=1 FL=1